VLRARPRVASLVAGARYARERSRLLSHLPRDSTGAEIGVWRGDFSARLLATVRPATLHLIDPWTFATEDEYERAWYGGALARSQSDMDAIHAFVLERFAEEIAAGTVVVHRTPSAAAARSFAGGPLDWAYVDGNHLYPFVRGDLDAVAPKGRVGGFLAGDDYGSAGWWEDGVRRAVDEFVERSDFEPVLLRGQFLLRRTA